MKQSEIAKILEKACPAFNRTSRTNNEEMVYEGCHCLATPPDELGSDTCSCILFSQTSCRAGDWPQLTELGAGIRRKAEAAAEYLKLAKKAIEGERNEKT